MHSNSISEEFKNIIDQMAEIVWCVSPTGSLFYCNKHWYDFTGKGKTKDAQSTKKTLQDFPPRESIHQEELSKLKQLWAEAKKNNTPFCLELRIKQDTTQLFFWHFLRFWPILNEKSVLKLWVGICSDIHALKEVQKTFQLVMDNIPIAIFWKDLNLRYLGCNTLFASHSGRKTTAEMIGKNDYDMVYKKEESDFFRACDRRIIESGKPEYHIIEPQLQADGKQAWLDTSKMPLLDASGNIIGVLGIYEDITERMKLEQQQKDFVATLTHDLKNPLLGTNRVIDLLIQGKFGDLSESQQSILDKFKESNSQLINMISNLLDVYRYGAMSQGPEIEEVNLNELLKNLVKRHQVHFQSKQIAVILDLPDVLVKADLNNEYIDRVMSNLLDNALKFTPKDGTIKIVLRNSNGNCNIEVQDEGPGITTDDQKELFHRFWQGTPGKKYAHGTGLGLYLCKQIVESFKGNISCISPPGKGATFSITLPLKKYEEY
ncbi:MAG: ATP-binding protein [Candidatus Melainabacteria bacterium]|nr:ATP-binding protein [Candidatus Melainabacteria bacterium]